MDENQKARERARAQSGVRVARVASSPRESGDDAATRLDERIAGQRKDFSGSTDGDVKSTARRTADSKAGIYREPSCVPYSELLRTEAEIAAKSRDRPMADQDTRPGAFHVDSSSAHEELNQMESDVAAKTRARPAASRSTGFDNKARKAQGTTNVTGGTPSGRSDLTRLESDIVAKARARPALGSSATGDYSSGIRSEIAELQAQATGRPGRSASDQVRSAPSDLHYLEADAAAKSRTRNSVPGVYREASTARTELSQLESDVAAKSRARPGAPQELQSMEDAALKEQSFSGNRARTELNHLESDVVSKQAIRSFSSSARPGITNVRELDERIAFKTGIPLEREEKDANSAGALEKYQARQDANGLSGLENKLDGHPYHSPSPDGDVSYTDVEAGDDRGGRLAVAIAIKEDEDEMFIPAAVEYDPDAKPPIYKNRRFRLYGLLACTLLVVVIAGVVGLLAQKEQLVYVDEPTLAPTSARYTLGIQEQLELVVGSEKLNGPGSAHYRAKEWIINEDTMQLSPDDANLVQRFLLAVFYFKTHEEGDWLSCNAQTETDADDVCIYQQLVRVFPAQYKGISWYRWLSGNHECMWAGVFCDDFNQLRTIDLGGQQIIGTLPVEVSFFPFLQGLTMSWNNIRGTIPPEYGEIKHLLTLELHYNQLTGSLPSDWSKAKTIQLFNIAANELTGTIPADIKFLTNLKGLFFFENFLTGSFPVEFMELSLLTFVRLQRNFFSGTLPPEIGKLAPKELWLHRMPLTGTIPSELGAIREVEDLRLHSTTISGSIPDELFNLSTLWRLDLYGTQLTGTLSSKVAQLTNLDILRIRDNDLSGQLPTELAQMTGLNVFWLEGNRFSGTMPSGICEFNILESLVADCLPSSVTGVPPLVCECCDLCCDYETGECEG